MKLAVRIVPNASRDMFAGRTDDGAYRIKVQSPPVEGAANRALVRFLAVSFGVGKSHIRILKGETARHKIIEIDGDEQAITHTLESMVP